MPPGSRRLHTKSRNGCRQCKKRKIKCDEQAPCCAHCRRWEIQCDYGLSGHPSIPPPRKRKSSFSEQSSSSSNSSSSSSVLSASLTPFPERLNLPHLELMHHFSAATSPTIYEFGDIGRKWQGVIPSQAMTHEFLMQAMLGISALHIFHLHGMIDSASGYLVRAQAHHNEALTLFRSTVTRLTRENCTAVASFSTLVLVFAAGIAQTRGALQHHDHVDNHIVYIESFRSSWRLFASVRQWIEDGPLGGFPALRKKKMTLVADNSVLESLSPNLRELLAFNEASVEAEGDKAVYRDAILQIQVALQDSSDPSRVLWAPGWAILISDEYLILLKKKQSMALLIFAHACVLNKNISHRWYVQNWSVNIIKAIAEVINPTWKSRMRWAIQGVV